MPRLPRFDCNPRTVVRRPTARAGILAVIYVVFCCLYIVISGRLAASSAANREELQAIETTKGVTFVIVTGLCFFGVLIVQFKRIKSQEETMIAQQNALRIQERRAVAAMCAATLAHDLNNLLMALYGLVAELQGREAGDEYLVALRGGLEKGITSLSQLSKRIASTAKEALPESEIDTDLADTLSRIATLVRKHPDLSMCKVKLGEMPAITIRLNAILLEEAVMNLLINAGQAILNEGHIALRLIDRGAVVSVEVHDNGPGVPEAIAEAIFSPCFTTKQQGTGVGLLSVKAFASSCGGTVTVGRSDLGGAVFTITIPKTGSATP